MPTKPWVSSANGLELLWSNIYSMWRCWPTCAAFSSQLFQRIDQLVLQEQLHDKGETPITTESRSVFVRNIVTPIIDNINYMSEKQGEVNSYVSERTTEAGIYAKKEIKKISATGSNQVNETFDMIKSAISGKKWPCMEFIKSPIFVLKLYCSVLITKRLGFTISISDVWDVIVRASR